MLNHLKPRREQNDGAVVGVPFVDIAVAAFQAAAGPGCTDVVCTLPAAAGAGDVPPNLIVPAAGVQGHVVIGAHRLGAVLDANISIGECQVTLAGGPGVGQITMRVNNPTAAAVPAAPAARTFRFYLDQ